MQAMDIRSVSSQIQWLISGVLFHVFHYELTIEAKALDFCLGVDFGVILCERKVVLLLIS